MFYKKNHNSKKCQVSCDNWNEVQEEIERLNRPQIVSLEYYNQEGLFAMSVKEYNTESQTYRTLWKKKFQE